ncbi:histone-lysine N-methyltransferase SETMAR-like [Augochlora pura]
MAETSLKNANAHRSGRSSEIDDDKIKALVQANKHSAVRELAIALKVSIGSVHGHLKSLGFVKKLDVWIPHELKEIHLTKRMNVCDQLTKHEENDPFLKRVTKNGLCTIMSAEKEVGVDWMKHRKGKQKQRFTKRR